MELRTTISVILVILFYFGTKSKNMSDYWVRKTKGNKNNPDDVRVKSKGEGVKTMRLFKVYGFYTHIHGFNP